jgi:hypothetical protein
MIGSRGGGRANPASSRVEICIAVADWARGPAIWVPSVPGGGDTGDSGTTPPRGNPYGGTNTYSGGSPRRASPWGPTPWGAGVAAWG